METALKLGDQFYSSVIARHRWTSEIIGSVVLVLLFHVSITFFAGRAKSENAQQPAPKNTNSTTGDQSPIISDPQGPVTIHQDSGK